MIVPIGHDQSIRRWPWVTIGIIAVCTLVQLYSTFAGPTIETAKAYDADDLERARTLLLHIPTWRWGYHTGSVRFGDNSRALDVYIALRPLPKKPLTDGAFAAAARAAEAIKNPELRDEILAELDVTHPGSALATR